MMTQPFTVNKPLHYRRTMVVLFGLSLLGVLFGVVTFNVESLVGVLPLLLSLLVAAYTSQMLLSNSRSWNRLFALPDDRLDEYERHARNAAYARAFRSLWLMVGVGLATVLEIQFFVLWTGQEFWTGEAFTDIADALILVWIVASKIWALPRLVAAWTLPDEAA